MTVVVASSPRDVVNAVSDWLDEFLRQVPHSIDGGT